MSPGRSGPRVMTETVCEIARPKVNLTLHVGPPKANGRHDLVSLVVFPDVVADRIRVRPAERFAFHMTGPRADAVDVCEDDNLVMKAARALAARCDRPLDLEITLEKHLPVAAGIGGGSCDAGAVLRALERLWDLPAGSHGDIAATLGGDGPVAYLSRPAIMAGEGENLVPVDFGTPALLLVNPGVACPTGAVFAEYDRRGSFPELETVEEIARPERLWDHVLKGRNDLEDAAISLVPEIAQVLETLRGLPGARLARMSGSGATCFAMFDEAAHARAAAEELRRGVPAGWWITATGEGGA
jgi:4-diphosphocytidyl-2-C-methyl-D-erythritol kinase